MINLGLGNSRLKDFYDLQHLATHFDFDGDLLSQAIDATFRRRGTAVLTLPPSALTADFYEDASKRKQWEAFWRKNGLPEKSYISLAQCAQLLGTFLLPPLQARHHGGNMNDIWRHDNLRWQR